MNLEQTQHYRALINTIDFFSQRLHVDQIVTYGYKIFEDLTLPEQGAIFTFQIILIILLKRPRLLL